MLSPHLWGEYLDFTWRFSGLSPDSELRVYSEWCLGGHIWYQVLSWYGPHENKSFTSVLSLWPLIFIMDCSLKFSISFKTTQKHKQRNNKQLKNTSKALLSLLSLSNRNWLLLLDLILKGNLVAPVWVNPKEHSQDQRHSPRVKAVALHAVDPSLISRIRYGLTHCHGPNYWAKCQE